MKRLPWQEAVLQDGVIESDITTLLAAKAGDKAAREHVDEDANAALGWVLENRSRSAVVPTEEYTTWAYEMGWSPPYAVGLLEFVRGIIRSHVAETPEESKARLILHLEQARKAAIEQGRVQHEISALKAQGDLLVPKQNIVATVDASALKQDLRHLSDEELIKLASAPDNDAASVVPTPTSTPKPEDAFE